MSQKKFQDIDLSHHAYALIAQTSIVNELKDYLEKEYSIELNGNPDIFCKTYEVFTIDDAREIVTFHSIVPIKEGKRKIIIIAFDAITLEAQNSLLKTLEEPADYANFFIITQKLSTLLNTIRSRVNIISFDRVREEAIQDMAKKFMKMQISERMIFVKNMVDEIAKEKKNKKYVSDFVDAILYELRESGIKENSRKIENSDIVAKYIQDRSPSVKMLMEYLALVL